MEEVSTAKLVWGVFCAICGGALGAYFGLSMGFVGALVCGILGAAGGSMVAFNPLALIAALFSAIS